VLVLIAIVAIAAGFALPMVLLGRPAGHSEAAHKAKKSGRHTYITFGDVVVNLADERLARYLKAKIVLAVEEESEKEVSELVNKKRVVLKNWLIAYLSDKTPQEVSGTANVNRLRREIAEYFNRLLSHDPMTVELLVVDVLFEEFVVQ